MPACAGGYSRAYLHYLFGARELTALRLVTLHNLAFVARLMAVAVRALCDGLLAIPMEGGVESLNVASAGAVAAFELRRRRRR